MAFLDPEAASLLVSDIFLWMLESGVLRIMELFTFCRVSLRFRPPIWRLYISVIFVNLEDSECRGRDTDSDWESKNYVLV